MAPDKDRPGKDRPGKDRGRKAAPIGHEVAYRPKEPGRPLQRKMAQKRFDDVSDSTISAATHGEDESLESRAAPPPEDRAG